jgi:hypothetical protein
VHVINSCRLYRSVTDFPGVKLTPKLHIITGENQLHPGGEEGWRDMRDQERADIRSIEKCPGSNFCDFMTYALVHCYILQQSSC